MAVGDLGGLGGIADRFTSGSDLFAGLEQEALASVLGDPTVSAQLSPLVLAFSGVLSLGADAAAFLAQSGDISPRDAARFATNVGMQLAQQVADSVGGAVGAGMSDLLPVLGMMLDAIFSQNYAGQSPQQVEQAAIDWCRASFRPVQGTGPGGKVYPADVFVNQFVPAGTGGGNMTVAGRRAYRSTVGLTFVQLETLGVGDVLEVYKMAAKQNGVAGWNKVGIPAEVRVGLANLRETVEFSATTGDDAQVAWLLYLDLVNTCFKNGWMNESLADYLSMGNGATSGIDMLSALRVIPTNGKTPAPAAIGAIDVKNCRRYGRPGLDGVMELVEGWKLTVEPRWNADKLKYAEVIVEARKAVERLTRVQLLGAALKKRPRIAFGKF